jgi:hypothetical protein
MQVVIERLSCRIADVEACAGAGVAALLPPGDEAVHQVGRIEAAAGGQAVGQGQRHAGVVGPLPRLKAERAAAGHLPVVGPAVAGAELERGAERVANREADQRPTRPVDHGVC